jgi:hypothetical protein
MASSLDRTIGTPGAMAKVAWLLEESQRYEQGLAAALKLEMDNVAAGKKPTLSAQDRNDIVDEINNEAEKRKSYYILITTTRAAQVANESVAEKAARQQIQTYKYLESNLDAVKVALNASAEDQQKKMKMVEINTYTGKQFQGYGRIARAVAVVASLLVVLYFVRKYYGFDQIVTAFETTVQWVGGIYLIYLLYDLVSRRNDNYDEYIFPMAPRTDTDLKNANAKKSPIIDISGIDIPGLCAGSYCCGPGTKWTDNKGCVVKTNVQIAPGSSASSTPPTSAPMPGLSSANSMDDSDY